jgi:hypothetical protein
MRFTERLTNYGDNKVELRDKFDKFCEICEANIGNEAVGFCKMCENFMCLNCCKHHEKIPLSESHVLIGKDKFKGVKNERKLFDKSFTIFDNECFQKKSFFYRNSYSLQSRYDCNKQQLGLAQNIDDVWNSIGCFVQKTVADYELMLLWQDNKSKEIKEITCSKLSESHNLHAVTHPKLLLKKVLDGFSPFLINKRFINMQTTLMWNLCVPVVNAMQYQF